MTCQQQKAPIQIVNFIVKCRKLIQCFDEFSTDPSVLLNILMLNDYAQKNAKQTPFKIIQIFQKNEKT